MNNTKYPHIEGINPATTEIPGSNLQAVCEMCGKPRTHIVTVATTYHKGDNEYVDTCEEHKSDLTSITKLLDYS